MNKFCENYSPDNTTFVTLITNILKVNNGFGEVFFNSALQEDNTLLVGACGVTSITNNNNSVQVEPDEATTPNQNLFVNFWSNSTNAANFANALLDTTSKLDNNLSSSNQTSSFDAYYTNVNLLIVKLFNFLVCAVNNGDLIELSSQLMENWHIFLSYNRGFGGLNACSYCIDNYFIPNVPAGQEANAGAIVRKLIGNNPYVKKWCGCCIPQTTSYTYAGNKKTYNFANPFTKDPSRYPLYCESFCHNSNLNPPYTGNNNVTIPMLNGPPNLVIAPLGGSVDGGNDFDQTVCSANICVIDDVSINAVAYQGKPVTFNQVCSGCTPSNNCICYSYGQGAINKISSTASGTKGLGNPIVFKQNCPNAFCYQEQADGSYQQVKCNNSNPSNTGQENNYNYNGNGLFNNLNDASIYGVDTWLIPVTLIVIFIIFFLGAIFTTVYKNRIVPREKHKPNNTEYLDSLLETEL